MPRTILYSLIFRTAAADVNLLEHGGHSPLIMASLEGHTEIVQAFVSAGADVNLHDILPYHGWPGRTR